MAPIDGELLSQLRELESRAIALAEAGSQLPLAAASVYDEPLELLGRCISLCARYASAYNNRAQVLQLAKRPLEALADCDAAIMHATEAGERDRTVLMQAHTQRGLLRRSLGGGDERQQDAARADLERAGALGSLFAKTEAVKLNPYAALCNKYLQQAVEKQWSGLGVSLPKQATETEAPQASSACASSASQKCDAPAAKPPTTEPQP